MAPSAAICGGWLPQRRQGEDARDARQGARWRKPGFIVAALPLALLFAYGFARLMLEVVFPLAKTRH